MWSIVDVERSGLRAAGPRCKVRPALVAGHLTFRELYSADVLPGTSNSSPRRQRQRQRRPFPVAIHRRPAHHTTPNLPIWPSPHSVTTDRPGSIGHSRCSAEFYRAHLRFPEIPTASSGSSCHLQPRDSDRPSLADQKTPLRKHNGEQTSADAGMCGAAGIEPDCLVAGILSLTVAS